MCIIHIWDGTASGRSEEIARSWLPNSNVLVVDDLPTNLLVARGLLKPYGLQVDTVLSGQEAVEMFKAKDYDIVLMDHMMPEMDGVEALAALRTIEGDASLFLRSFAKQNSYARRSRYAIY